MRNLTIALPVLFGIIVLSGCVGAGVHDAEQARAMEGRTPGGSIWSLFGGILSMSASASMPVSEKRRMN
jgi:hypothetical protein